MDRKDESKPVNPAKSEASKEEAGKPESSYDKTNRDSQRQNNGPIPEITRNPETDHKQGSSSEEEKDII